MAISLNRTRLKLTLTRSVSEEATPVLTTLRVSVKCAILNRLRYHRVGNAPRVGQRLKRFPVQRAGRCPRG